ncbi:unnamed protein product [Dovyalis caffra]|uniref:Alkaline/neutral invertase n=1 Tax=Dovyalis caffra TaxID=77055 RepID=A0AAV1R9Z2_9ROSI|nr:unnamed protein product [Dovyalis caffra]
MDTSKTVLQVLSCSFPCTYSFVPSFGGSNSVLSFYSDVKCRKNRGSAYKKLNNGVRLLEKCTGRGVGAATSRGKVKCIERLESMRCKCQQAESFGGATANDWRPVSLPVNGIDSATNIFEKGGFTGKGKEDAESIEEEAWDLLRASVVHYCGNPIGTIAANDPNSTSILNYDQVFIRDFIPSGIAFLLKGEYDIVRNFILYTLQLQSWEKTMDSYSPGQGLMPASFKVRTVPLDGEDSATEEVLDADFGEAAIGRVAPVDSDGSCMIDRRMGIHGHPLEIQVDTSENNCEALFYSALLCAREMLTPEDGSADLIRALNNRLTLVLPQWRILANFALAEELLVNVTIICQRPMAADGYLVAKLLLANPSAANMFINEEDPELVNALISANPRRKRARKGFKQPFIV